MEGVKTRTDQRMNTDTRDSIIATRSINRSVVVVLSITFCHDSYLCSLNFDDFFEAEILSIV